MPGLIFKRLAAFQWTVVLLPLLLLSSCNVTKHLDTAKGERFLIKNTIEFDAGRKLSLSENTALQYEYGSYFRQKPNKRPLLLLKQPWRVWHHYRFLNRNSRYARWVNKVIAEPPAIYDENQAVRTAKNLERHLQNQGYLNATCTFETKTSGKLKKDSNTVYKPYIAAKYTLHFGPLHTIESVNMTAQDSNLLKIIRELPEPSLLKPGKPLDRALFDQEKLRISAALKNRGYAYFGPNFIRYSGDSTGTRTRITLDVLNPGDTLRHKVYTLNKIYVYPAFIPDYNFIREDTTLNGIYYCTTEPKFNIKPKYLSRSISLQPSWPYLQREFDKTNRNLNGLGVYRFVSIKPVPDSTAADKLDVIINLTPNDEISTEWDADFNSSTSSGSLVQNLIGAAASFTFQHRNLFHGAEHFSSSVRYNIEFDVSQRNNLIFSQQIKLQNDLVFPRFFDYLGIWDGLHRLKLGKRTAVGDELYNRMRNESRSRVALSYNFLNVTNFYYYNLFYATYGFDLRSSQEHQYSIDHIGIDVLQPEFGQNFSPNEFLRKSFGNQLFTGFLLRSFSYTFAGRPNRFGERWGYRMSSEVSGLEILALNRLWAIPFGRQEWKVGNLDYAQYFRMEMDGTYTRDFSEKLSAAVRVGSGVALAFGDSRTVPFVKQYFIGGPSGLRAWRIRELGPGGFRDPNGPTRAPFFQSGDFRFEFNGELRFPLFWWFKGAVFVDGGNIWSLDQNDARKDARLSLNSYKNIALGTGAGIRFDFSYAVIRLDWGLKLRYPYQPVEGRNSYWTPNLISKLQLRDFVTNLSVGYPF